MVVSLLVPLVLGTGMFFATRTMIDEVFVNLEHPWNLFHHGRFSFSSQEMIDGTVEIVYYGLLTPFAWSHDVLLIANYAFGLLIALGHIFVYWLL